MFFVSINLSNIIVNCLYSVRKSYLSEESAYFLVFFYILLHFCFRISLYNYGTRNELQMKLRFLVVALAVPS